MNEPSDLPPPAPGGRSAPANVRGQSASKVSQMQELEAMALGISSSVWSGPMPPPDVLKAYEEIYPGAAQQLFDLHEKQAHHRMMIEREAAPVSHKARLRGQWMSFGLALCALAMTWILTASDQGVLGIVLTGLVILPTTLLGGILMTGRWIKAKDTTQDSG